MGALPDGDLAELRELLRTAGVAVVGELIQKRDSPHPNLYLGPGKVDELKALAKAADANLIATDDELSPRQERNLEKELGIPVVDRTTVILDIFAGHAHSADGKLQVELAQLEYNLARMRGLWTHLERLGGRHRHAWRPGESQIETDRRLARDRIAALRRKLARRHVHPRDPACRARARAPAHGRARGLHERRQVDAAQPRSPAPTSACATGCSTRSTRPPGRCGSRGAPTWSPTRSASSASCPTSWSTRSAATLEETKRADLLLHVVDASAPEEEELLMSRAVEDVLEEIGTGDQPRIMVLNKVDAIDDERRERADVPPSRRRAGLRAHRRGPRGAGRPRSPPSSSARCATSSCWSRSPRAARSSELHDVAGDLEREDTEEGVRISVRLPAVVADRYDRYAVNGNGRPDA